MITHGIYKIKFGSASPGQHTFFCDAGLKLSVINNSYIWTAANGSSIEIVQSQDPGLIEVQWASSQGNADFLDVNGVLHTFRSDVALAEVLDQDTETNTFAHKHRINQQVSTHDLTVPCAIAHVAVFTPDINASCELFKKIGFVVSDSVAGKAIFMRSKSNNPHHQILLAQSLDKTGLHHAALAVNDIYSVVTKGLHMASQGWKTVLGPGRHVISSSTHWYFDTDLGSFELSADEDYLTSEWTPTEYDPATLVAYEWAIEGGLDPVSRRQVGATQLTKTIHQPKHIVDKS